MANVLPTEKQHRLLEFIGEFIGEHGYAPSYREVMGGLEYKSVSTVAKHIDELIRRGWLLKRDNSARSVEVVYKRAGESSPTPSLPEQPEVWLEEKMNALYQAYREAPTSEMKADIETLIRACNVLGLSEVSETYRQKLEELSSSKHQIS